MFGEVTWHHPVARCGGSQKSIAKLSCCSKQLPSPLDGEREVAPRPGPELEHEGQVALGAGNALLGGLLEPRQRLGEVLPRAPAVGVDGTQAVPGKAERPQFKQRASRSTATGDMALPSDAPTANTQQ